MKNILYSLIVLLAFGASSCTPEPIDIEIPQAPVKPVLASQFYYDSITEQNAIVFTLSKSMSALDGRRPTIDSNGFIIDYDLLIGGAQITVTLGNDEYICQEGEKGMYYAFNVVLNNYNTCKVDVKDAAGNAILNATSIAMPEISFSSVSLITEQQNKYVTYRLQDNPSEQNWYLVNYFTKQKQDSGSYSDPKYIAKRLTEQKLDFDLYTDTDFKNGTLQVKRYLGQSGFDTIAVAVSSITNGYYNFLSAQKKYGLLVNQIKGEVINFPTNINNGLGYFTVHQPKLTILVDEH